MKRTIKYILFSMLGLMLLAGAAVALAAPGDRGGPDRPGGPPGGRGVGGQVTSIDGSTINVENPRGEAAIVTDGDTEFIVKGESGSLADIAVGMFVRAEGEKNDDGAFSATRVFATDEAPPRPEDGQGGCPGPDGQ